MASKTWEVKDVDKLFDIPEQSKSSKKNEEIYEIFKEEKKKYYYHPISPAFKIVATKEEKKRNKRNVNAFSILYLEKR